MSESAVNSPQISPAARIAAFKWQPGQSGNPSGRPKGLTEFREVAQDYSLEGLENLVALMRGAQSESVKFSAIQEILNRAWGRPDQLVEVSIEHKSELLEKIYALLQGKQPALIEQPRAPDAQLCAPGTSQPKP